MYGTTTKITYIIKNKNVKSVKNNKNVKNYNPNQTKEVQLCGNKQQI